MDGQGYRQGSPGSVHKAGTSLTVLLSAQDSYTFTHNNETKVRFFFYFLFLIDFFWSSFRFTAKLRGSTKLPIHSLPPRTQPPHHHHKSGVFITTGEPTLTHHHHPRVHRGLQRLTSAAVRSMGLDNHMMTVTHHCSVTQNSLMALNSVLHARILSSLLIPGKHSSFPSP